MSLSVFFGAKPDAPMSRPEIAAARAVCTSCPVRRQCLKDALEQREEHGVRGGYTAPERLRAEEGFGARSKSGTLLSKATPEQVLAAFDHGLLDDVVRRL